MRSILKVVEPKPVAITARHSETSNCEPVAITSRHSETSNCEPVAITSRHSETSNCEPVAITSRHSEPSNCEPVAITSRHSEPSNCEPTGLQFDVSDNSPSSQPQDILKTLLEYLMIHDDDVIEYGFVGSSHSIGQDNMMAVDNGKELGSHDLTTTNETEEVNKTENNRWSGLGMPRRHGYFKRKRNMDALKQLVMKRAADSKGIEYVCPLCPEKLAYENIFNDHWLKAHAVDFELAEKNIDLFDQMIVHKECETCLKVVKVHDYVKNHVTTHDREYDLSEDCMICSMLYDQFTNHMAKHKPYWCMCCNKRFMSKKDLDAHLIAHVNEIDNNVDENKVRKCIVCSKKFLSVFDDVLNHLVKHHETGCNFLTSGDLMKNLKLDEIMHCLKKQNYRRSCEKLEAISEYMCLHCPSSFHDSETFANHLTRKHDKSLKCERCEINFPTKRLYQVHMKRGVHNKRESKQVKVNCTACKRTYTNISNLTKHLKVHRENDFKNFDCPLCSRPHYNISSLLSHLKNHTEEKAASQSSISDKKVSNQKQCSTVKTNQTESLFNCMVCNKEFQNDLSLKKHTATHFLKKP